MEIQQKDDEKTGMFFAEQDDKKVAEMIYTWKGKDQITIEHTEVDDALKGQGIAKKLLAKSVEFARQKGIKIVPVCMFAKSIFDKNTEFHDVLSIS